MSASAIARDALGTHLDLVVALAERLETSIVVTLDRRHFSVVRPRHADTFELLPN